MGLEKGLLRRLLNSAAGLLGTFRTVSLGTSVNKGK
jgi:hypothetical protein